MPQNSTVPLEWFLWPYYLPGEGGGEVHLLCRPGQLILDSMAGLELVRHLPSWIRIQPSRPIRIHRNAIFIGDFSLFLGPQKGFRQEMAYAIGTDYLRRRGEAIDRNSCFRAQGEPRVLVNTVTGETFTPRITEQAYWKMDYGVVRRLYLPDARTVLFEGVHGLGTDAAVRGLTDPVWFLPAWDVLEELRKKEKFVESASIEILYQGFYKPVGPWDAYDPQAIQVVLLAVVYNRNWIYRFDGERRWVDQRPFGVAYVMRRSEPPRMLPGVPEGTPRVEVEGDLSRADSKTRRLCRLIMASPAGARRQSEQVLRQLLLGLTQASDCFSIELVEGTMYGDQKRVSVPKSNCESIRIKKKFLIHLILARILGLPLGREAAALRFYFPAYKPDLAGQALEMEFRGQVRGKLKQDIPELMVPRERKEPAIAVDCGRCHKTFNLTPLAAPIIVRIRLGD